MLRNLRNDPRALLARGSVSAALLASTCLVGMSAQAQDATWAGPGAEWTTNTNWSPQTVPTDTAIFAGANPTSINISANTSIGTLQFNAGAPAYSFIPDSASFYLTGAGIVNNSANAPNFTNNGVMAFFNSSTAGNATITNNVVLQFFNSSTAGTATITNNTNMFFDDATSAGSAAITNLSRLDFSGTSSAGNATIGNNATFATLNFLGTSTAGNATITNSGTLSFSDTSTAANATITNDRGITFDGSSTAANATIINNRFLEFAGSSTAGSATITNTNRVDFLATSTAGNATITNNATVAFSDTASAGSATMNNLGEVHFSGTSTAGNATIVNNTNSSLNFTNQSTAGNAIITTSTLSGFEFADLSTAGNATINNNWTVLFNDSSTAGNATITNNFRVRFNDASTAGNASIINNDSLVFLNTSTAGNATITTNNGAVTSFTFESSGGQARFITNFGGTFDISALSLTSTSAGSIEGAGSYVLGTRQLVVGGNNLSTEVSGVISGIDGGLTKVGTGTLTLSGSNSYTGNTTINEGTLSITGSIAPSSGVTVGAGGILGGTGIVPTTVINGGSLAPGLPTAIGTLSVAGNLTFTSGNYVVNVSPAAADRTNASGTAVLTGGSVQAQFQPGSYTIGQSYTILTAAGGLGGTTFSGLATSGPVQAHLAYDANNVFLVLDRFTQLALSPGLSRNQQAVGDAINGAVAAATTLPPAFIAVLGLPPAALPGFLTQVSGELGTGAPQAGFQSMGQFLSMMLDPFLETQWAGTPQGRAIGFAPEPASTAPLGFAAEEKPAPADAALAFAAMPTKAPAHSFERRWGAWGSSYGGWGSINGDASVGSHDLNIRNVGFAGGLDYRFSPDAVIGFAAGGGSLNYSLSDGLGSGRGESFQAGAYGALRSGAAYLSAAAAYARHDMSTDRLVLGVPGFANHLTADFTAHQFGARLETGYRVAFSPASGLTPYGAVQAQSFRSPSYTEKDATGLQAFELAYKAQTTNDIRSELGARLDGRFLIDPHALLILRGRAAWVHDYTTDRSLDAAFQALPLASFSVVGASPARDAALLSAGADLILANGVSFRAKFDGELSNQSRAYTGTGALRVTW